MEYAVVNVPAAPVRRKPMHYREMVNQLLFGESVRVLKSQELKESGIILSMTGLSKPEIKKIIGQQETIIFIK